jgi:hypothetical protein
MRSKPVWVGQPLLYPTGFVILTEHEGPLNTLPAA